MPNIPGANTTVGAASGVPGSNVPGQVTLPGGELPTFHAAPLPTPSLTNVRTTPTIAQPTDYVPSVKAHSIASAMALLDQVHQGAIPWQDAQRALSTGVSSFERDALKHFVSQRYGPQAIDALRALGDTNPQSYGQKNILQNLGGDITSFVKGAPAGIALAGVYAGEDLASQITHPTGGGSTKLLDKLIAPAFHAEANLYSPLIHGDVGQFYKQFHAHPLGPILDALAVASAGVGTAGRVNLATRAVRAGEVTRPGETVYHPLGYPKSDYVLPTNAEIEKDPWKGNFSIIVDKRTGKALFSPPGSSHDEIYDPMVDQTWPKGIHPIEHIQATGHFIDGKIHVDLRDYDEHGNLVPAPKGLESKVLKQANELFLPKLQAPKWPKGATAVVGRRAGISLSIHPLKNGLWQVRDRGKIVASRFPDESTAIAHAQSLATGGVAPAALKQAFESAPELPGETKLPDVGGNHPGAGLLGYTEKDVPEPFRAPQFKYSPLGVSKVPFYVRPTPEDLAREPEMNYFGIIHNQKTGKNLFAPVGNNHDTIYESLTGKDITEITPEDIPREWSPRNKDAIQGMGHFDPDTGEIHVDLTGFGEAPDLARDDKIKAEADKLYLPFDEFRRQLGDETKPIKSLAPAYAERQPVGKARLAATAALRSGTQGNLITAYERARGITHTNEVQQIMDEVASVLDNPNLRLNRRTIKEATADVVADLRATRQSGKNRAETLSAESPGFVNPTTAKALTTGGTLLREASDLVRAGAVYIRGGYLPNNWAGNEFMNVVQQGVYAPLNLAKSLVMDKAIGARYTRAIDQSLGSNAAQVLLGSEGERIAGGRARGYVASAMEPTAHVMGALADQPFRRAAWLHEARRRGYRTLTQVQQLLDRATQHGMSERGQDALHEVADIGRASSEEIVKFRHMNDIEKGVLRNLVFVYSWMRGAARYALRFPFAHPIQTAAYAQLAQGGNKWLDENMGGVPSFLIGAIPIGHDSKGNPLIINPFSLNPLGTGLQVGQAVAGTAQVLSDPKGFNKYAQQDIVSLANPLIQAYVNAREGGAPAGNAAENSIAAVRLVHELQHPGSGSIFPTSRTEAVGHFLGGSLYPRLADQAALTRSLQREHANDPASLIPEQLKVFQKATGETIPKEMVDAYKADLLAITRQKAFQTAYASSHGSSGFRHLPAQNRAEAALEYLSQYSVISPQDLQSYQSALSTMTTDAEFNDFANTMWNSTGVGAIKRQWDSLIRDAQQSTSLTRKR